MDRSKIKYLLIVTAFILTTVCFLEEAVTSFAAESCNVVTIRGRGNIEPHVVTIKKGDCVVWINFNGSSPGQPMQSIILSFKDGGKCIKVTKSPVGFKMDASSGCYVAGWLGFGETSSLMFTEPGTYNYEVQFKVGGKDSGTIIVE